MLFNSIEFFIFFPLTTLLFFKLPEKWRPLFLFLISCYFYMAFVPIYILILFFLILVDYFAGLAIEPARGHQRKVLLAISLVANCSVLVVFKYYNFFTENIVTLLSSVGIQATIPRFTYLLPIGLSFHTFQAMSYTLEVYYGRHKAERNLLTYAIYVMFYPQLVAGPIERPRNLLDQLQKYKKFDYERAVSGMRRMLWGLFKKMVIADNLSRVVDRVYTLDLAHPDYRVLNAPGVWVATYCFAFQIYCDFSGYSDVAIGAARVLGVDLSPNFNAPYKSKTIQEFWRRWHMSLSFWFRDYLYRPLQERAARTGAWWGRFNRLIIFLVSGLWHGANWTYVAWGAFHGIALMLSSGWQKIEGAVFGGLKVPAPVRRFLQWVLTFHLVCIGWIFFRASSIGDACYLIGRLRHGYMSLFPVTHIYSRLEIFRTLGDGRWAIVAIGLAMLVWFDITQSDPANPKDKPRMRPKWDLGAQPWYFRWAVYYAALFVIWFFRPSGSVQFIYFQF